MTNKQQENWVSHSPIEDARLFQHIAQVDVSVEKVRIQCDRFLEMMYSQPNFVLCIKHTTQIAPGHRKVRPCFDRFQIARLQAVANAPSNDMEGKAESQSLILSCVCVASQFFLISEVIETLLWMEKFSFSLFPIWFLCWHDASGMFCSMYHKN